ncbi:DoxX family membrane protein [Kibdelosporangium aridum]|uniref:DoxX family membrane protein n=1 Tax=Kibdelosporangium aridum TaxID=2030 RepID=A0A428ZAY7_KIBAR|nr:DoxX family protein [Kibdelosporangium aridum]RSM85224.1 DoxX family membrane protein [Kibdelosporangium aridum]
MTVVASKVAGVESRLGRGLLALARVGVAYMWIQNVAWKDPSEGFAGLRNWTRLAVDRPVLSPYAWLVDNVVLPNMTLFGWITLLVEAGLGAFLLAGLATRLWALIGAAQSMVIALSVLNAPHEWPWAYYLMILIHLAFFATAAGRAYGVDGVLRPSWQASSHPLARVLVRLS